MSVIETMCGRTLKARPDVAGATQNSTDASFPSRVNTLTEPTGTGVIEMSSPTGNTTVNGVLLTPYLVGADDTTASLRVIGWDYVDSEPVDLTKREWVPRILVELSFIGSTSVGATGGAIGGSGARMADTITVVTGSAGVTLDAISPTGNVNASALVDTKGCRKIEITFDMGTATSANCLVKKL